MEGINLSKHYALTSSDSVKGICDPLLSSIGITYFNYIKIYHNDCSRELLTNNPEWIDHFYTNALYNTVAAIDVEHILPKGYVLWSEFDAKEPIYLRGREYFNIDNGITFVVKRKEATLLYIFASNRENHAINNFYAANIDLLQRFIHYFTEQGQKLIKDAAENRIYLPRPQVINTERVNNIMLSESVRDTFLRQSAVSKYYLINEADDLYLTSKQAQYASLFIKGLSAKEIARQMNVSFRTVEGHIFDIKQKVQDALGQTLAKEKLIQILRAANIQ